MPKKDFIEKSQKLYRIFNTEFNSINILLMDSLCCK